jgi:hypothetical protein
MRVTRRELMVRDLLTKSSKLRNSKATKAKTSLSKSLNMSQWFRRKSLLKKLLEKFTFTTLMLTRELPSKT